MGGAGAWHLGLHHPSPWAAVEAGAGFTETIKYARLDDLPEYQRTALHIYDAADYALNAFDVPIVGYGGEEDPQLRASENIVEALTGLGFGMTTEGLLTRGEGLDFLRVVGAGMGHKVDPASREIIDAFVDEHAAEGVDYDAAHVRFVTYTTKYNRAAWIEVPELIEHYRRATVDAEVDPESDDVVDDRDRERRRAGRRAAGRRARRDRRRASSRSGRPPAACCRTSTTGANGDGWIVLDYDDSRAIQLNIRTAQAPGPPGADRRRLHRPLPARPRDRHALEPPDRGVGRRAARPLRRRVGPLDARSPPHQG